MKNEIKEVEEMVKSLEKTPDDVHPNVLAKWKSRLRDLKIKELGI